MFIGLLRETLPGERRVALTPTAVRSLTESGHRVVVEHHAGERSHFPDPAYTAAGAQLAFSAGEVIHRSQLLVKVERPTRAESEQLVPNQTVMAFYHLAVAPRDELARILDRSITAIGFELIRDAAGRAPVLEPHERNRRPTRRCRWPDTCSAPPPAAGASCWAALPEFRPPASLS